MAAINSTQQLAKIRSQIDIQQQIIGQLEMELQFAILGSPRSNERTVADIVDDVRGLYDSVSGGGALGGAVERGVKTFYEDKSGDVPDLATQMPEQDSIRHMLYQARALLGELRIEEQQWNEEAKSEKEARKALTDFAKG